jgi:hypothetical protein
MLKFHSLLGTNPPAVSAPGAKGHVVEDFPPVPLILIVKGACRTVLHTGKAPIAMFIHLKERHGQNPLLPETTRPFMVPTNLKAESIIFG